MCESGEVAELIRQVGNFEDPLVGRVYGFDRATCGVWEFAHIGSFTFENCVRLEKLPDSFTKLATLKILWLEGCKNLIELPMEFGNLQALELLDLENCVRLEKLPDSFAKLATLKILC